MKLFELLMFSVLTTLLLVGCTSKLDNAYNESTASETLVEIKKDIDSVEYAELIKTILRKSMKNEPLLGLTYRELLEQGMLFKLEQERLAKERDSIAAIERALELDRIKKFNETAQVFLIDKGFEEYKYEKQITLRFSIKNLSDKDIRAISGVAIFNDLLGNEIMRLRLNYDNRMVRSNSSNLYAAGIDYNQFMDDHQLLRSKSFDDIKFEFEMNKILFSDGSIMEK